MKNKGFSKLEKGMKFTISFVGEKPASNKKYNNVKLYGIELEAATSNPDVDALLGEVLDAKPVEGGKLTAAQITKVKKLATAGFVSEEIAEGQYANLAIITHSHAEFVVDFVNVMPGTPKSRVKSRIILTPQHAKRLLNALADNINKFEDLHGVIKDFEEVQIPFQFGGPQAQA